MKQPTRTVSGPGIGLRTAEPMGQPESYESKWASFHRRRTIYLLAGAIAFAITVVGGKVAVASGSVTPLAIFLIAAIVGAAPFCIPYLKWRCPRCGDPFLSTRVLGLPSYRPFARLCMHCKLPIEATHTSEE